MNQPESVVARRQAPLKKRYLDEPEAALIADGASTDAAGAPDAVHGRVTIGSRRPATLSFGIHAAVGGDHDLPNPGDILCAALAACMDATLRMVADRAGLEVVGLVVNVKAEVDVRGTLAVSPDVSVGFQSMHCSVKLTVPPDAPRKLIDTVIHWTERSCVNLQTLRGGVDVDTAFQVNTTNEVARAWQ
jgi:uncharacterized OsmC-like protein